MADNKTVADLPTKNAAPAEPAKSLQATVQQVMNKAITSPTDAKVDFAQGVNHITGDPQQKSAGAADPMPTLKAEKEADKEKETVAAAYEADEKKDEKEKEDMKEAEHSKDDEKKKEDMEEGEMPAGLKKYLDKKDDAKKEEVSKDDKEKEEGYGKMTASKHMKKEEAEAEKKDEKKEEKEDKKEIDVKEHVDALVAGEDSLSEEFKTKAATVFEAAIKSKVKEIAEEMQADFDKKLTEETSKSKDELVEKVDSYLAYVVEEWMKENELALERGIKGEIAEDFIGGLKKLFEDHYIDVPDEKYNVLEDQASKIEELEKKLNESIEKNVELSKENGEHKRQDIIDEASADLAETQKEKFNKLAEEIDYKDAEDFKSKVDTIKESYFGKKESTSEIDDVAAESSQDNPDLTNAMAAYSAAISKTKDIKLSN